MTRSPRRFVRPPSAAVAAVARVALVAAVTTALTAASATNASAAPAQPAAHRAVTRVNVVRGAARFGSSRGYHVGVAVLDRATGRTYSAGAAHGLFASESVIKVFIATRLLVGGQMHGRTARMAYKMITQSDDQMASALYPRVGGDNLLNWVKARYHEPDLGYPPSHANWWGNTKLTPIGLVRVYAKLARDRRVAPWLLNAMHHARKYGSDGTYQFFGLPSATRHAAIKQGWGCDRGSGCSESDFNSTGFVNGDRYAVALLARGPLGDYGGPISRMLTGMARTLLPNGRFPSPPPVVLHISQRLTRASGGGILRVRGNNFVGVRWVQLGTKLVRAVDVHSPRRLSITLPAHVPGTVHLRVGTAYGTSRRGGAATALRFVDPPSLRPAATRYARLGGGGRITFRGHGFIDVRSVRVGGKPATDVRTPSPQELSFRLPAHAAGPVGIRVISRFGSSPYTRSLLRYVGRPAIGKIDPVTVPLGGGTVTITGTNFVHVSHVRFGKVDGTNVQVVSPTQLRVTAPPHAAGSVPVHVLTGFGTSAPAQLTYSGS